MRILNTLYVSEHRCRVTVRKRALEIRKNRNLVARYPMSSLDSVVLVGRAQITSEAMTRCTGSGIAITSLSPRGRVRFRISPETSGNVLLRVAQLRAHDDPNATVALMKSFVAGKISNQYKVVRRWTSDSKQADRPHMESLAESLRDRLNRLEWMTDANTIRGIEGDAARVYFKGLGAYLSQKGPEAITFDKRTRRPPRGPVNSLLSYCYGLVLSQCAGALESVGLDPQVGYLHRLRPGRPSLALDLMEEFRPVLADRFVVAVLTRRQIGLEHFETKPGGAVYLTDDGRRKLLGLFEEFRSREVDHVLLDRKLPQALLPSTQATLLARHIRGDIPVYPPYVVAR